MVLTGGAEQQVLRVVGPGIDVADRAALVWGANAHVVPVGGGVAVADGLGALCRFRVTPG